MKLAASIGTPISEFWEMTPYELNVYAGAYYEKLKAEFKEKIALEYWNAKWTIQWLGKRHEQPAPLNKILDNLFREKKVMTDNEMFQRVKILNMIFGGEIKT